MLQGHFKNMDCAKWGISDFPHKNGPWESFENLDFFSRRLRADNDRIEAFMKSIFLFGVSGEGSFHWEQMHLTLEKVDHTNQKVMSNKIVFVL